MTTTEAGRLGGLAVQLDAWQVPGLQIAVVHSGQVVLATGLGVKGIEDPGPVSSTTLFHHGSCGKAYTSLLAARLAVDGTVDLDAPVRDHVPELRLPDPLVEQRVSLRDLLSHRSGIGRHDLVWILDGGLDAADLVRRLQHLPLGGDFRTEMGYSNLGYALAGLTLERATGRSFHELLREQVLAPLDMGRTFTDGSPLAADPDAAHPHLVHDGRIVRTPARTLRGAAPAGQLITSAQDAARWLQHQVSDDPAVRQTHELNIGLPTATSPYPELRLLGYALGWVVVSYRGRLGAWHSGGVDGFLTMTLVLPDSGTGVTVCANQHLSGLPLAAVLSITDGLLGEPGDRYQRPSQPAVPESQPTGPAAARSFADYAGTYTDKGYGVLRVQAPPDGLTAALGESRLSLQHRGFETWDATYAPLGTSFPLTFVTGPDGTVDRVLAAFDLGDPICFTREEKA